MSRLRACPARERLIHHSFFRLSLEDSAIDRGAVERILGQWWHPLHYFPDFLAKAIAQLDRLEHKSFLADILNEELGMGDPDMAHERIYVSTMTEVGFETAQITQSAPLPATQRLLASYQLGGDERLKALACVFATEVADLAMVGGIGKIVRRVTGAKSLPWVDIHISQEPNHVQKVTHTLGDSFSADEIDVIVEAANEHWLCWIDFFDALSERVPEFA